MILEIGKHIESYNGSYMVILTLIYVVCTFLIWLITKKQISQVTKFEKERTRPYLIFDIYSLDRDIYFKVENIGMRPALNAKIILDPMPCRSDSINIKHSNILTNIIRFLPPGRSIKDFFDSGYSFFSHSDKTPKAPEDLQFNVKIEYQGTDKEQYSENYKLDLNFQKLILQIDKKNNSDVELEKLNKNFKNLISFLKTSTPKANEK